jgi:hypothetical protein
MQNASVAMAVSNPLFLSNLTFDGQNTTIVANANFTVETLNSVGFVSIDHGFVYFLHGDYVFGGSVNFMDLTAEKVILSEGTFTVSAGFRSFQLSQNIN